MKRVLLCLIVGACVLLCACGEKPIELIVTATPTVSATAESTSPAPTVPAEYNSIEDGDKSEIKAVREQLLSVAQACQDIYAAADKGGTLNVVLNSSTVYDMVVRIGEQGCSALDAEGKMDMCCPEPLISFGELIFTGGSEGATYYMVYHDGQISAYHLSGSGGVWFLTAMSASWDENNEPKISSEGRYAVSELKYTDKGWLIYSRDIASFDDNQQSNTLSYVFIRVKPYDSTKRSLGQRYIEPIGYFENNLFTTSWSESNFAPIDFNSLYSQLFGMYNGTENLSARNESDYYSPLQKSNIFIIPTSTFEKTVKNYFRIDGDFLKSISDYSSAAGGYMFLGYRDGYYNVTPRTPEPEVVDYWYNSDGTLTLRVDAVNKWYGTDKAFTHDLTVLVKDDGSFKYVSNVFYDAETNVVPECKLSYLLNIERSKTDY